MNELISIKNQSGKESVSARELYEFLGFDSGNWTRWAKQNIEDNPFAESGEDYMGFLTMRNGNGTKDFALTMEK
jgi:phage anti-repressor protein